MTPHFLLNSTEHSHMGWKPAQSFEFAARHSMVQVGLHEMPRLLPIYPLAFSRPAPGAALHLVVLTGVRPGRNLFVVPGEGRWTAPYVPQAMALHPFMLQPNTGGARKYGVAMHTEADALRPVPGPGEHRFFTDEGLHTPAFAQVIAGLEQALRGQQAASRAAAALQAHQLLEPWPGVQVEGAEASTTDDAVGLFRVNEPRLNALSGDALKALQLANALALAYAQLLSLGRMEVLHRLDALYARKAQAATAAPPPDPAVVQKLFDPGQPDTIQFNW